MTSAKIRRLKVVVLQEKEGKGNCSIVSKRLDLNVEFIVSND
jgi:hypothetical protein